MAVTFNGTSNLTSTLGSALSGLNVIQAGWVKNPGVSTEEFVFGAVPSGGYGPGALALKCADTARPTAQHRNNDVTQAGAAGADIGSNVWQPFMALYTSGGIRVWFGASDVTGTYTAIAQDNNVSAVARLCFGGVDAGNSSGWTGDADEMWLWQDTAVSIGAFGTVYEAHWNAFKTAGPSNLPENISPSTLKDGVGGLTITTATTYAGATLTLNGSGAVNAGTAPFSRAAAPVATLSGSLDTITGSVIAGAGAITATLSGALDTITGNLAAGGATGRLTSAQPLRDAARVVLANRSDVAVHVQAKPGLASVQLLASQSISSGLWSAAGPFTPGTRYNVLYEVGGEPIGCEIITATSP